METLKKKTFRDWLENSSFNVLQRMQTNAEAVLNPHRYHLSTEAKKRLRWIYLLRCEQHGNVTRAARTIGCSRQWLSTLHAIFERSNRDPRSLEPQSRAPHRTNNRRRISKEMEDRIIAVRDATPGWGKEKITRMLKRDHGMTVSKNTVNRYLHKHHRIDLIISKKNGDAWHRMKERDGADIQRAALRVKYRPPKELKDYAPGALVEKDMKFVLKQGQFVNDAKYRAKENFWYQHTMTDSFTRIRTLDLVRASDSATAVATHRAATQRFPFPIAAENTDNGGENEKHFAAELQQQEIFHFFSTIGTPTDNPRVERSHRTDDVEFYQRGNIHATFEEQQAATERWERTYNHVRPHQALGYLTPMEFYALWKQDPAAAYAIAQKYTTYLIKQRKRLANTRRMKRKEQIENLMRFIDAKLNKTAELQPYKIALINCQLCSWA